MTRHSPLENFWQVGLRALNTYSGQVVAVVVEDASLVFSNHCIDCYIVFLWHSIYQELYGTVECVHCPKNPPGDSPEHWQFWQHPGGAATGAGQNFFGCKRCIVFWGSSRLVQIPSSNRFLAVPDESLRQLYLYLP